MKSPNHIAIIMDGNGRWGLKKFNNRLIGHKYGVKNIKPIINFCLKTNIINLTLFALSKDNFKKRNNIEIKNLFTLMKGYLEKNLYYFEKYKIKLIFIGEINCLPLSIRKIVKKFTVLTNFNDNKILINIALNYSSKKEIIFSIKENLRKNKNISEKNIEKYLYTKQSKDPELLIRTGGYQRLSDFLLWQSSYSEIFFFKKLWPDFKPSDLRKILNKYRKIKRKYGA
jgi:undecaprenyl diphosphate synthase